MPHSSTVFINRDIKNACSQLLSPNDSILKCYGDGSVKIFKLSKTMPKMAYPIQGKVSGLFVGTFERLYPYKDSPTVTREQFDDAMITCQCHQNSFAETDTYQTIEPNDWYDVFNFLGIRVSIKTNFKNNDHVRDYYVKGMVECFFIDTLDLRFEDLSSWHIIENCGNFRSLTCESSDDFYCFEMITS